ncbi:MAG: glycosyltransferase family 39 protein, partial [Armatimonadota bacterium]|nr:glycosyltransferase family 39 protein [Armatimonadota bacterium]
MSRRNNKKKSSSKTNRDAQIQRRVWILIAIVILITAAIRIRLLPVPLERDEGEYAYAGQLILKGIPPYLHVYNMKFPGIYMVYALIMALLGQTIVSIHLGLLIANTITIILVFLIAKRFFNLYSSVVGAATFALLSLGKPVLGIFAHATHFVILFALAGILLLLKALESKKMSLLFWSGICFGLSILMKQHGVFFALFALFYFVLMQRQSHSFTRRQFALGSGLFVLGLIIPFSITCLVLAKVGAFKKFWFWTFTYVREYATQVPLPLGWELFRDRVVKIFFASPLLWLLAAFGFVILLLDKEMRPKTSFVIGFWTFSFIAIFPGLYFREHYFVMTLPASALVVSAAFSYLQKKTTNIGFTVIPMLIFVVAVGQSLFTQREILFLLSPTMVSRKVYGGNPFPESVKIAEYL